jgi:hypothetical protein
MTAPLSSQRVTIVPRSVSATPVYLDDASLQVIVDQVGGGSSPDSLPSQPSATPASADSLVGIDTSAGSVVRQFPLSSDWRLGRLGIGVDPLHRMHIVGSGAAEKDLYITHNLQNGTGLADTYRPVHVECNYTASDIATSISAWGGINSTITFGNQGAAATGKGRTLATNVVVQGAGDANNEYTPHFSVLRMDLGTGYDQTAVPTGRAWLTDWNVHGPIGIQPDMLNGMTLFFNNHYNGSPADSPSGGIWLVTKKGSGGALDSGHQAADTYPVDVALGIVGVSNAASTDGIGWTKGIQIGGFGSGWMESGSSRIGTGIEIKDFLSYGIYISGRHASGAGPAIAVAAGAGPVIIGETAANQAQSLLEVIGGSSSNPTVLIGSTSGSNTHRILFRNGQGQHDWFLAGTINSFLTGTVAGDSGFRTSTAGKSMHFGGTAKVMSITQDNKLGFFAVTPVVRQTGGVATAGATYGTAEQTMLQAAYDALRAYGLLT